jgi:hypothetical protein
MEYDNKDHKKEDEFSMSKTTISFKMCVTFPTVDNDEQL